MDAKIKNIYFIGIGGVGMSGIAIIAKNQGYNVFGSDIRKSNMTDYLSSLGIQVFIGHRSENILNCNPVPDKVIVSTAILKNNPELIEAKKHGIEIWHRAQMLDYLAKDLQTLAVAGTHGKTSTSSILATSLDCLGCDPTFLIGGIVRKYGTNAKKGAGKYCVVEADESDKSFKYINPYSVIVTNIEADHLDHYKNLDEIYKHFGLFISSTHKDGVVIVCGDDKKIVDLAKDNHKNVITYGWNNNNDALLFDYEVCGVGCKFKIKYKDQVVEVNLSQNPGKHYAANSAAAILMIESLGFTLEQASKTVSTFKGVKRRFDFIGERYGITVVDDYAHHSTEIKSTIEAATSLNYNNVHVIWQPHRYSRAKLFCEIYKEDFGEAFKNATSVAFTDVYAAGETPIPGVSGYTFLEVISKNCVKDTEIPINIYGQDNKKNSQDSSLPRLTYLPNNSLITEYVKNIAKAGDLVITMGAGNITTYAKEILNSLN